MYQISSLSDWSHNQDLTLAVEVIRRIFDLSSAMIVESQDTNLGALNTDR